MNNIVGLRTGKLIVTNNYERRKNKYGSRIYWECECECGNKKFISYSHLVSGHTKSCGCLQKETVVKKKTKTGLCSTRIYKIWVGMNQRCFNPKNSAWEHYGGRGIRVCNEWSHNHDGFKNFYDWSLNNGYEDNLTIERIDVDKDYSPENCKWETWGNQRLNTRNTVKINYLGENIPLIVACKNIGVNYSTARSRIKKGCSVEEVLSTSKLKRNINRKD